MNQGKSIFIEGLKLLGTEDIKQQELEIVDRRLVLQGITPFIK